MNEIDGQLEEGQVVRDIALDRVGEVMDVYEGQVFLRPLGGGREWEAAPGNVRRLTARQELSARLAATNARSRSDFP